MLKFDIRKYALELAIKEIPDFLGEYCSAETIEKLINRILIHSDVSTPRQVKKLLNAFVNNYMIAYERESSGKVETGLFTSEKGQQQIAKFSVLQADFNRFYDLIFQDFSYLEGLLNCHQNKSPFEETPADLRQFFIFAEEGGSNQGLKRECEPLINYLTKTRKFAVDNIAPYLYLAQDDISRVTGDETQRRIISALESGNRETVRSTLESTPAVANTISHHLSTTNDEIENVLATTISLFEDVDDNYKVSLATIIADRTLELPENELHFLYKVEPQHIWSVSKNIDNEIFGQRFVERYLSCFTISEWIEVNHISTVLSFFQNKWDSLYEGSRNIISDISELCLSSEKIAAGDLLSVSYLADKEMFEKLWGFAWFTKLCAYIDSENDFSDDVASNFKNSIGFLVDTQDPSSLVNPIIPLTTYSSFINVIDEAFDPSFSEQIQKPNATRIASNLLSLDYDECKESIYSLLAKLHYSITVDNAEIFSEFTLKYKDTDAMDAVLVYCGQNAYFALLDSTIQDIIKTVFIDNSNDGLLEKIQDYFTEEQRNAFFTLLASKSIFSSNDAAVYERPSNLILVASKSSENNAHWDLLATNTLLQQFAARYTYGFYFEFTSSSIGIIKPYLQTVTIDTYLATIVSIFSSSIASCLEAIERLTGVLSEEQFAKLFPLIIQNTQPASFELALDIIINNGSLRPTDGDSRSMYRNFLVSNVATSENPERVIRALESSFNYFSNLNEFIQEALKNDNIKLGQLVQLISKSFNKYPTIEKVVEELLPILQDNSFEFVGSIVNSITKYQMSDIIPLVVDTIDNTTSMTTLNNVLLMCNHNKGMVSFGSINRVIKSIFAHDNVPAQVSKAIRALDGIDKTLLSTSKNEIAATLYDGFHITSSEDIKMSVLAVVSNLQIKRQFRALLNDDELDFYKKWTK